MVGIRDPLPLTDGRQLFRPEFAPYDKDGSGLVIEGHGVDPDIVVDNDPAKEFRGEDQQLDKGIEVILEELKTKGRELAAHPAVPEPETHEGHGPDPEVWRPEAVGTLAMRKAPAPIAVLSGSFEFLQGQRRPLGPAGRLPLLVDPELAVVCGRHRGNLPAHQRHLRLALLLRRALHRRVAGRFVRWGVLLQRGNPGHGRLRP